MDDEDKKKCCMTCDRSELSFNLYYCKKKDTTHVAMDICDDWIQKEEQDD